MRSTSRSSVLDGRISSHQSRHRQQRVPLPIASKTEVPEQEYRVGPGRPPKEYQFKPGQSGNPKGSKQRRTSLAPDLKAMLERALSEKTRLRRGEKEQIISKAAAGIEKLVNQFAEGDRYARRDLIILAEKLGVDLTAGQSTTIARALTPPVTSDDQALVDDYVRRRWNELNSQKGSDTDSSPLQESSDNSEENAK